jgi:hypothetical protein
MKLNKDNLIGVIIGFIVLVIFAVCLSSGCTKRITPVPEIRYVPVTDSTAVNELVLTKELLRRTQDSLNAYKSDTTISADYFVAKYKLERIRYYNDIAGKGNNIKFLRGWIRSKKLSSFNRIFFNMIKTIRKSFWHTIFIKFKITINMT